MTILARKIDFGGPHYMKVAVLGASKNPHRYSNMAIHRLLAKGHEVIPIHPTLDVLENLPVRRSLSEVTDEVHTLTVYLGQKHLKAEIEHILKLRPKRVILNPGTESIELMNALDAHNIPYLEACTLVMLGTGQF